MGLRDKYAYAIQTAKGIRFDGSAEERDGKLHWSGYVNSEDEKNQIWNALKTIPEWRNDIVADIKMFYMVGYTRVGPRIDFTPDISTNSELQIAKVKFK